MEKIKLEPEETKCLKNFIEVFEGKPQRIIKRKNIISIQTIKDEVILDMYICNLKMKFENMMEYKPYSTKELGLEEI